MLSFTDRERLVIASSVKNGINNNGLLRLIKTRYRENDIVFAIEIL